jgi:hypothetical protein
MTREELIDALAQILDETPYGGPPLPPATGAIVPCSAWDVRRMVREGAAIVLSRSMVEALLEELQK